MTCQPWEWHCLEANPPASVNSSDDAAGLIAWLQTQEKPWATTIQLCGSCTLPYSNCEITKVCFKLSFGVIHYTAINNWYTIVRMNFTCYFLHFKMCLLENFKLLLWFTLYIYWIEWSLWLRWGKTVQVLFGTLGSRTQILVWKTMK